ncbi:MAG TPA: helix-turn-helix domain-containing protein [Streptosporangiaceae bacterium]|jgi:sugar diacid utilization regulator
MDLAAITRAASREAGGVPPALLGDYLPAVADAAASGRRLTAVELAGYGRAGERAAEGGVALRGLVDLFLSATWRLWRELPGDGQRVETVRAAGLAVLRAADDAVAAAAEGFERAHLAVARRQEGERREFFEDLLSGRAGAADLIARGEGLGLRLAGPHQVVLAGPALPSSLGGPAALTSAVAEAAAPAPSLVTTRAGQLVAIVGATGGGEAGRVARALVRVRDRLRGGQPGTHTWQVAVGRPYQGPAGVLRSYEEAVDALDVARRLGLPEPVVSAAALLIYQVLLRDRSAIGDLVRSVLGPLAGSRGGAGPLLTTLTAYYAHSGVATAAARDLHLSVRAVTYRLARVKELTGWDPSQPDGALNLQVAVIGARLLGWPATPLDG